MVSTRKTITWGLVAVLALFGALSMTGEAQSATIPGRVAISSDGNFADCNDIFSSAITIALLAKTGNASKLVYYGYTNHYWKASADRKVGPREEATRRSTVETAQKYGGFDMTVFVNSRVERNASIDKLTDAIDDSTSTNPLWIIAVGPEDIVARALAQAAPSRRPYVTVVSHDIWNADGGDPRLHAVYRNRASWSEVGGIRALPKREYIADQYDALWTSRSTYSSWRDSSDPRLRWLWSRNMEAGTSWPDCTDAGMAYWLAHGRTTDEKLTPSELKMVLGE